ncbi:uncharacterized protein [Centroberyx affinis]|uniref:uncharacterized protein isoform X1 n=1 Tax=Centroberyx affinis TaxID=166261 RepID=UPI003A5B9871
MADSGAVEKTQLPTSGPSSKIGVKKPLTEQAKRAKGESDRIRNKSRVNLGQAFTRWRELRQHKGFKTDTELACFLLNYLGANPLEVQPALSSMDRNSSSKNSTGCVQLKKAPKLIQRQDTAAPSKNNSEDRGTVSNPHPIVPGVSTGSGAVSSIHHAAAVQPSENGADQRKKDNACQSQERHDDWTMTTRVFESKGQNGVMNDSGEAWDCLGASTYVDDGQYLVDLESPSQHIVDEECILQLFRTCLECNKQCTVRKRVRGLQLVVYQACYFCHCRCKWTNQPEPEPATQSEHTAELT